MNDLQEHAALVECIPNFSEGRNPQVIDAIVAAIASVPDVYVLHVDVGADANRTVVTFVGPPLPMMEAAYRGISTAAQLIDMRQHRGAHPRIGATDVCPFVPIRHISPQQLDTHVQQLAQRVGTELQIPLYLYEQSARVPGRTNLADIRKGEYEGLGDKMRLDGWQPDYGPAHPSAKSGATVMGVRPFLIAYNVCLATRDVGVAQAIAERVRERGRMVVHPHTGERVRQPGLITGLKAIGWDMPAYQCAQVSCNITSLDTAPLHLVYDAVSDLAPEYGTQVTGSELIGLVPKQALLDTGYHLLRKEKAAVQVGEDQVLRKAIAYLRFDAVKPFDPMARILEFALGRAMRQQKAQDL
jgi:glutamate formiminotransferase/formiminotetrahydrofolate cyclodeaminase